MIPPPVSGTWREALRDAHPKIFSRPGELSVRPGWRLLLDELCTALQWQTDHNGAPQLVAIQVNETPTIACDYGMDRALFLDAWAGLEADAPAIGPPDVHWFDLNHLNPHYTLGLEAHFADNPDARRRRHHALVDAFASRAGYLHAIRIQAGR